MLLGLYLYSFDTEMLLLNSYVWDKFRPSKIFLYQSIAKIISIVNII